MTAAATSVLRLIVVDNAAAQRNLSFSSRVTKLEIGHSVDDDHSGRPTALRTFHWVGRAPHSFISHHSGLGWTPCSWSRPQSNGPSSLVIVVALRLEHIEGGGVDDWVAHRDVPGDLAARQHHPDAVVDHYVAICLTDVPDPVVDGSGRCA